MVEVELRKSLPTISYATYNGDSLKDQAIHNITKNEDILFHWEIVSVNWCSTEAQELLKVIVEHYVTIRGFSFTKGFMEKYKQSSKKTTQKSKCLRKTLDTNNVCHNVYRPL